MTKALLILKKMADSANEKDFEENFESLKKVTNEEFQKYFNKYLKIKEKWVFCYQKSPFATRTNMHIESWHKTLKYQYFKNIRNKRVDKLIITLMEMSKDAEYFINIVKTKGYRNTFNIKTNERHTFALKKTYKISQNIIKVFLNYNSKLSIYATCR